MPMVDASVLLQAEFGPNDHREDAPRFILNENPFQWLAGKLSIHKSVRTSKISI